MNELSDPGLFEDGDFRVGPWLVQPRRNLIHGPEGPVRLEPKIIEVLACLAGQAGQTVSRERLHEVVWRDSFVTEKALTRAVWTLRRVFGDDAKQPAVIETIPKRGYRLIAPVTPVGQARPIEASAPAADHPPPRVRRSTAAGIWGLAAALAALAAAWLWLRPVFFDERSNPAPAAPLTSYAGHELRPRISPSGDRVVFAWAGAAGDNWDLYVKQIKNGNAFRLTEKPGRDLTPAWSPDGSEIAYTHYGDGGCGVYIQAALAGAPRKVADCFMLEAPYLEFVAPKLAWSPDGRYLAFPRAGPRGLPLRLALIPVDGGPEKTVTRPPDGAVGDLEPSFSPDGRFLAFTRLSQWASGDLHLVDLETSRETRLTRDHRTILGHDWHADGRGLVFSSNRRGAYQLWSVPRGGGEPSWIPAAGGNLKYPSMARGAAGRWVYENWRYDTNLWGHRFGDASQPAVRLAASTAWDCQPAVHRDTRRLAFVSNRTGGFELWLRDGQDGEPRQLTHLNGALPANPSWSPDGDSLAFEVAEQGRVSIWTLDVADGQPRRLAGPPGDLAMPAWSADGVWLYHAAVTDGVWQIWRSPIAGGQPVQVTREGGFACAASADGETLFFAHVDRRGLWRLPLAGGAPVLAIPELQVGDWGNWALTGQGVFYLEREPGGASHVAFWDGEREKAERLLRLDQMIPYHERALAIWPGEGVAIVAQIDETEADVMVVTETAAR